MRSTTSPDPFGTEALRATVLNAWRASPARFREDANAEEELFRGAYRDRVIVELAQNGADAARQSGGDGRLLIRLDRDLLLVANTGAPLDGPGVAGLSSLRASAKRGEESVGRFGVGFAAVLAVTDEPLIAGARGAVRWSRRDAVALVAGVPELADEVTTRDDAVPVLRLPMPATGEVPEGYETCVTLRLRDGRARELASSLVASVDDGLLLTLPGLTEVIVETGGERRTMSVERPPGRAIVTAGRRRTEWRLMSRSGRAPAEVRADRPVEEPDGWQITVAVPVGPDGEPVSLPEAVPRVVHAPTPTDDRTDLPALLVGTFPLDSSRRRIVPGPLADLLAAEVAAAYADVATSLAAVAGARVLDLVPGPLAAGEIDAILHDQVVSALRDAAIVSAASTEVRLRPRDCVLIDGLGSAADPSALAPFVHGLPAQSWWRWRPLRRLGAREVPLADVVDELSRVGLPPERWRGLYAALDGADPEALSAIPVPLTDGRQVRGGRGAYVPAGEVAADVLDRLGLRVVAPAAVHPLLYRVGAVDGTPAAVLADPQVQAAIGDGDESASAAVLDIVAASAVTVDDEPWLAGVVVPSGAGELSAAGDLWFPDAPLLPHLDLENAAAHVVPTSAVRRWGRQALRAVGVRDGFGVVRDADVPLDGDTWHDLDGEEGWLEAVAATPESGLPPILTELVAVRDLDLVRDDAWPHVLRMLADDPGLRPAVLEPALVVGADGASRAVQPYSAWWLTENARVGSRPLTALCVADSEPIVSRLLAPLEMTLDDEFCRVVGISRTLADLVTRPADLLDRLADPGLEVTASDLSRVYVALDAADVDVDTVRPPDRLRVPSGGATVVVDAGQVVVADGPQWYQLGLPAVIAGSERLADLLDVDLAAEVYPEAVPGGGEPVVVPDVVSLVLPEAPASYVEHDELVIAGTPVQWWVARDGRVHAATPDGLARGLAWVVGAWGRRYEVAEVLRDRASVDEVLAERQYDNP